MTLLQVLISLVVGAGAAFGASHLAPELVGDTTTLAIAFGAATVVSLLAFGLWNRRPVRTKLPPRGGFVPPHVVHQLKAAPSRATNQPSAGRSSRDANHSGGTRGTSASKPAAVPTADVRTESTKFTVGSGERRLEVSTEPQGDGTVKVTVVAIGYSGSEFKQRVRPRLENVRQVKWRNPTNLGDRKRQIEGVITGTPGAALAAISGIRA